MIAKEHTSEIKMSIYVLYDQMSCIVVKFNYSPFSRLEVKVIKQTNIQSYFRLYAINIDRKTKHSTSRNTSTRSRKLYGTSTRQMVAVHENGLKFCRVGTTNGKRNTTYVDLISLLKGVLVRSDNKKL